jgi:signal peptidase I
MEFFRQYNARKQRGVARRWLKIARRDLERHRERYSAAEREDLARRFAALEATMPGDDPDRLAGELAECRRRVDRRLPFYRVSWVRENVETIVVALALALFIRAYIVQTFKIPSGSMIPTLLVGDQLVVNKFTYGVKLPFGDRRFGERLPHRGDIVVFRGVDDPSRDLIKRVIGLPGDVIEVHGTDVLVNGEALPHAPDGNYSYPDQFGRNHVAMKEIETIGPVKHVVLFEPGMYRVDAMVRRVPDDDLFCMGDNRDHSADSRVFGFVPMKNVKGKAMIIHFSWPPTQWNRIGTILR